MGGSSPKVRLQLSSLAFVVFAEPVNELLGVPDAERAQSRGPQHHVPGEAQHLGSEHEMQDRDCDRGNVQVPAH